MNETVAMTTDLDRLAERIEKAAALLQALRTERERLERDRDQLGARVQALEQKLQGGDPATLLGELQSLRREKRDCQVERREVALRIEALIKKLERLEG
jgi:chromosome segregation ATPase